MSIDPTDQPTQPKRGATPAPTGHPTLNGDQGVAAAPEVMDPPILAAPPDAVNDEIHLPGDATGPVPGESPDPAVDGARRPDKVAIAMMVGVVVLLLICVAFAFAAR